MLRFLWNYEVRLLPILASLSIFGVLHLMRKLTKIAYTPSYFAIFPLSRLDYQLSEYFEEVSGKKTLPAGLFQKSLLSMFLTLFVIPLLIGFIVAFFLTPSELRVFLILLLLWQGSNCASAVYDFWGLEKAWKFFGAFYLAYLACLVFMIRRGYNFAFPHTSQGDFSKLASSVEAALVGWLLTIALFSVLAGIFAYWLINKDVLRPIKDGAGEEISKEID